ncbi:MAG: TolC family protein [Bacteroidota bacterium]
MLHIFIRSVLTLSFVSLYLSLQGQSPVIQQYVETGLANNQALQRQDMAVQQSLEALREARGLFYPTVDFQASYTLAAGGRLIQFPVGDLFNPVYGTLNQLTETENFPTDLENEDIQFLPNNFHETKVRITQPILNSDIYFNRQAKIHQVEVAKASRAVYVGELTREIKVAYIQYIQAVEAVKIYDEAHTLLQEILRVNKKLVASQKATSQVISQSQFELSQVESQQAQQEAIRQTAAAYFNFLLNRPLDTPIEVDTQMAWMASDGDLSQLQTQALTQRPVFTQLDAAIQASDQGVKRFEYAALPELGVLVDLGYQGFGYTFDQEQAFFLGAFSLNWNLFQGRQTKAQKAQAQLEKAQILNQRDELTQQVQLQVTQAYHQLAASKTNITSAKKGQQAAQEGFDFIQKRYLQQQVSFLELVQARTDLTQTKLNLNLAQYAFWKQQAQLDFALGNR